MSTPCVIISLLKRLEEAIRAQSAAKGSKVMATEHVLGCGITIDPLLTVANGRASATRIGKMLNDGFPCRMSFLAVVANSQIRIKSGGFD
jgi:hypothetical protein